MALPFPLNALWCRPSDGEGDRLPSAELASHSRTSRLDIAARDADIVARLRQGEASALAELFDTLYEPLVGFAKSLVHSLDVAQEIVQDVFLHVWASRAQWAVRDTVRGYFFGAVHNRARNVLRRRKVETRDSAIGADLLSDAPPLASTIVEGLELHAAVSAAFARLTPRRRMVLELRWYHGLHHEEIAGILGISVKGVEQTITRALRDLRTLLAAYDPDQINRG